MEEQILLSKSGVIHILAGSAYREFEKTPRRRATAAMNILFACPRCKPRTRPWFESDKILTSAGFFAVPGPDVAIVDSDPA